MVTREVEKYKELFCRPGDERAVLSFAMKNTDFLYTITAKMDQNGFLYPQHRLLFTLMKSLVDRNIVKLDLPLLINEAHANNILTNIGGYDYLQSICDMRVSVENFDAYLSNVIEAYTKYSLYIYLIESTELIETNSKQGLDSDSLLSSVETGILDLSADSKAVMEPIDFTSDIMELIDKRKVHEVKMSGLSFGYPILSKLLDGLIPGTLMAISARKKMGKSALLTNISLHVAYKQQVPTLYVDTEMTFCEWRDRVLSILSGIEERKIKHGGYNAQEYDILTKCVKILNKGNLYHYYMPGYTLDKLAALYKKYHAKHGMGFMVFDYIKEPDSKSIDKQRKEYQVLGDVTTKLKDLAGQLNVPALTAVQINRDGDVADSDRIARYGDIVAQWMPKTEKELEDGGIEGGNFKLVVRDTRRGGNTTEEGIAYKFAKKKITIQEVEQQYQLINYFENEI